MKDALPFDGWGSVPEPPTLLPERLKTVGYLHRSCLPMVEVDLGGREVTGGVAQSECEGMCGL